MAFYTNFPGRNIFNMKKQFDRMYEEFMRGREEAEAAGEFYPPVSLEEAADQYILIVELPGLKKEDVKITFTDGKLILSGEKKGKADAQKRNFVHYERDFGKFYRKFSIDGNIKENKISAEFHDGLLEIHLPKEKTTPEKEININIH